jgi:hypothetical protein
VKRAATFLVASLALAVGFGARDARGEHMTCLGSCRTDYGICLRDAKNADPSEVEAQRAACGRAYVQCSTKCHAAGTP